MVAPAPGEPQRYKQSSAWLASFKVDLVVSLYRDNRHGMLCEDMGVRPTQLTAYAFLTKCPNHAFHPVNG